MSTAINYNPDTAAAALLAEQTERERVIRDLAVSYGDLLEREQELDTARVHHVQLRQRAAEFGITDTALKKAGINPVTTTRARNGTTRRSSRRTTNTSATTQPPANSTATDNGPDSFV